MKKLLLEELNIKLKGMSYHEIIDYLKNNLKINIQCIMYSKSNINEHFYDEHEHDIYQVMYVESGEFIYIVNNISYFLESGDFLLIPPHTLHKLVKVKTTNYKIITLQFDDQYLKNFNTENTDITLIFNKVKESNFHQLKIRSAFKNRINSSFSLLEELFLSNEYGDDILFNATLISLFVRMNKGVNFYDFDNYYKDYIPLFIQVNNYIDNHIDKKILIKDIAEYVGLSESRLSHIYKEQLGISILQQIINKRLTIAKDMLKIGESISDVSAKCGFQDYSSFLRTFKKKYNISPKAYQKQYFIQQ